MSPITPGDRLSDEMVAELIRRGTPVAARLAKDVALVRELFWCRHPGKSWPLLAQAVERCIATESMLPHYLATGTPATQSLAAELIAARAAIREALK